MAGRDHERKSKSPVRHDEQVTNIGNNDSFIVDREKVSLCFDTLPSRHKTSSHFSVHEVIFRVYMYTCKEDKSFISMTCSIYLPLGDEYIPLERDWKHLT